MCLAFPFLRFYWVGSDIQTNGDFMKKKGIRYSVFYRSILIFSLIMFLLYVIGVFLLGKSRQMMIEQYRASIDQQISLYFSSLQDDVNRIIKIHELLVADDDMKYLSNKNIHEINFNTVQAINRIMRDLMNIKTGNEYIKSIRVNYVDLDRRLTSDTINYNVLADEDILLGKGIYSGSLCYYEEELYIVTIPFLSSNGNVPFYIDTQLDKTNIMNRTNHFNVVDSAVSCIYFEDFEVLLYSDDKAKEYFETVNSSQPMQRHKIDGEYYWAATYYSEELHLRYMQFIPEKDAFSGVQEVGKWYFAFSLLLAGIACIYAYFSYVEIKKPFNLLFDAFRTVEDGDFDTRIDTNKFKRNEFGLMCSEFNNMILHIKMLINDVYLQKILIQKAEMRQLQAQINPHFLYNSFYILKRRIQKGKYDQASDFADMLGQYFNYLNLNYNDYTTLGEEIRQAQIYAHIQGIRFDSRIDILFEDAPPGFKNLQVPRLILQPILENSFKYGLEEIEFDGLLKVSFEEDHEYAYIFVEGNAKTFEKNENLLDELQDYFDKTDHTQEISGLLNIHKRLQLFSGNPESGLIFSQSEYSGLKVCIKIGKGVKDEAADSG